MHHPTPLYFSWHLSTIVCAQCVCGCMLVRGESTPPLACAATSSGAAPRTCGPSECPRCVSFTLFHKCASTTLLHVMRAPLWRSAEQDLENARTRCGGVYYCDWMAYGASGCLAKSSRSHELADRDGAWLYFGGYLPAIAPSVAARGCRRIALLRDPVSRLLSARAYCERGMHGRPVTNGGDVLCGNRSSGSITVWARHWGAYLFRQLALEPSIYAQLSASHQAPTPASPGCTTIPCTSSSTFTWLDQRAAFGAHDDGTSTRAGRAVLRTLASQLGAGRLFDVVAVYEEWNASMALLDATLPLTAGRRWAEQSRTRRTNSRERRKALQQQEERATLESAQRDPKVTRPIAADRRLYVAGLGWFYALCRRHAIVTVYAGRRALAENLALTDALHSRTSASSSCNTTLSKCRHTGARHE